MIRLGTRGSALALAQAGLVKDAISKAQPGLRVEVVPIRSSGDERRTAAAPPTRGGDKSRFVKEIEDALLRSEVDLGVHSAKDVPSQLPEGLEIVGVPERGDARDVLCGSRQTLDDLPRGAVVGTSSLRRRAQLLARRPDLRVEDLRGNVDTRLRRLDEGSYDALVLAAAGLARLGRDEGQPLSLDVMVPAAGQGCLALEARAADERATEVAAAITDRASLERLTAERALVAELDASCRTPLAAHAAHHGPVLELSAFVGLPDGATWIRDSLEGDPGDPAALGSAVAARLLAAGAAEVLQAAEAA